MYENLACPVGKHTRFMPNDVTTSAYVPKFPRKLQFNTLNHGYRILEIFEKN